MTFRGGEKVETAEVNTQDYTYTYDEGDQCKFMNMETYEEASLTKGDWYKYMKEGMVVTLKEWNGQFIDVQLPIQVTYEIAYTEPGEKGDSAGNPVKDATLDTGAAIKVPLFINTGDKIKVDTRDGSYVGRDTS